MCAWTARARVVDAGCGRSPGSRKAGGRARNAAPRGAGHADGGPHAHGPSPVGEAELRTGDQACMRCGLAWPSSALMRSTSLRGLNGLVM